MRIAITGHRGMPAHVGTLIAETLNAALDNEPRPLVGISCIADGPDSQFAQAVLERGGELLVVVPAARYRDGLPAEHHPTYDQLIAAAFTVHTMPFTESTSEAHMAASEHMLTEADELWAVWDGKPARGHGGTADVVQAAHRADIPVRVLWPEGASRD